MCGITGFLDRLDSNTAAARLAPMLEAIQKRGPDGEGRYTQDVLDKDGGSHSVGLGHRRLSIIDLEGGSQPLGNEDDTIQIVFNGEIFNFQELREDLKSEGHVFRTESDTEVIVHLYEQHGVSGFDKLNGMFAFAIWDSQKKKLVLARDRAGIKPLYYRLDTSSNTGLLVFASQLDSVLKHPLVASKIDTTGLGGYFFSDYAHAPTTVVEGVRKLEPGHWLSLSLEGKVESGSFWKLQNTFSTQTRRLHTTEPAAWAGRLARALETAVERQLIADVPVGSFLSGGIDSSLITAIAVKKYGVRLNTFSIGFKDPQFDESIYAQKVADHFNTIHHTQKIDEEDLLSTLNEALDTLDEPMADPSLIPTYILSKLAAKTVKVVLGGDGGDELFGGYPTYVATQASGKWERTPETVRKIIRGAVRSLPSSHGYQPLEWKLKRFTLRWDQDPVHRHLRWMSALDVEEVPQFVRGLKSFSPAVFNFKVQPQWDPLQLAMALDFSTYMPGSVLTKVDRASMACGLEVRPPFLDNDVVSLAHEIPSDLKVRGKIRKLILKQMAEQYLPLEIVHRPKKGFAIPLSKWIAGPLDGRLLRILGDSPVWEHLSKHDFESLRISHLRRKVDGSKPLWSLLVFDHWLQKKR